MQRTDSRTEGGMKTARFGLSVAGSLRYPQGRRSVDVAAHVRARSGATRWLPRRGRADRRGPTASWSGGRCRPIRRRDAGAGGRRPCHGRCRAPDRRRAGRGTNARRWSSLQRGRAVLLFVRSVELVRDAKRLHPGRRMQRRLPLLLLDLLELRVQQPRRLHLGLLARRVQRVGAELLGLLLVEQLLRTG